MPKAPAQAHKDKSSAQLALGRGVGTYTAGLRLCPQPQCFYSSRSNTAHQRHLDAPHSVCPITGCTGIYSKTQKACHLVRVHNIKPTIENKAWSCRFAGCTWSCDKEMERDVHEDEMHVHCDVIGCDWRGGRREFLRHERLEHDPEAKREAKSLTWTPAEQAVLDFIWLKHQNFNDTLDILIELFPHRISTGNSPMQNIKDKLVRSKWRYENMDMSMKGDGIVDYLKGKGLLQ